MLAQRRNILVVLVALAVAALSAVPADACPSCKAALASADDGGNLVNGMFWSIMFMLSMPFLIVGGFSLAAYRAILRARAAAPAAPLPASNAAPLPDRELVEV